MNAAITDQRYSLQVIEETTLIVTIGTVINGGGGGADGLSAYEVAVANGFVGTEVEWLLSLHGADGLDGIPEDAPTDGGTYARKNGAWVGALPATLHGLTTAEYNWLFGQLPANSRSLTTPFSATTDTGSPLGIPDYMCLLTMEAWTGVDSIRALDHLSLVGKTLRILVISDYLILKSDNASNFGLPITVVADEAAVISEVDNAPGQDKRSYQAQDTGIYYLGMRGVSDDYYEITVTGGGYTVYNQNFLDWMDKSGLSLDDIKDIDTTESKATPIDVDSLLIQDSEDTSIWKKLTWANCKATLKTYFDGFWGNVTNQKQHIAHGWVAQPAADPSFTGNVYSRTFATPCDVAIGGILSTLSTTKDIDISALAEWISLGSNAARYGQWFIWMKADLTLMASKTPWSVLDTTIILVDTVYCNDNGVGGVEWIPARETHQATRNLIDHNDDHFAYGTKYISGFNTLTVGTGAVGNSTNTFALAGGEISDEGLRSVLSGSQTTCRIGYKHATANALMFDAASTAYTKLNGSNKPYFDNNGTLTLLGDAGSGTASTPFGVVFEYASNRYSNAVVHILGQAAYANQTAAEAAASPTLYGLSVAEWKLVNIIVFRAAAGTGLLSYVSTIPQYNKSTGPAINAGALSTVLAGNVTYTPTSPDTAVNVQAALDERMVNPMTTAGDIIVGGASGVPSRLALGSALQGLRVNAAGTAHEYAAVSGGAVDYTTAVSITSAASTPLVSRLNMVSGTTGDYTVGNFPSAASNSGKVMHFKIATYASANKLYTINSRVYWADESVVLWSDGSNWLVIDEKLNPLQARADVDSGTTYLFNNATATRLDLITVGYRSVVSMIVTTAGQGKIVIPRTGTYNITPFIFWYSNHSANTKVENRVYKNGAAFDPTVSGSIFSGVGGSILSSYPLALAVGDYLEMYGFYDAGTYTTRCLYSSPYSGLMVTEVV